MFRGSEPQDALSFTDETSRQNKEKTARRVWTHAQISKFANIQWFLELRNLYPDVKLHIKVSVGQSIKLMIKGNMVIPSFAHGVGICFQMSPGAIGMNQCSYLGLFNRCPAIHTGGVPVVAKSLLGKIIAFEKLLPGRIDRGWVAFVILVELVEVAYVSVRDVGVFVHSRKG